MRHITKVFIDGDIVAYRVAAAADYANNNPAKSDVSVEEAQKSVDRIIENIVYECLAFPTRNDYEVFLTGKQNFRYDIAKAYPYKGNRQDKPKPQFLPLLREHMQSKWGAIVSEGEEADDLISKAVTQEGPTSCVASIDKDMLQLNCWHYNFVKDTWTFVDEFDGLFFFYQQILMGDSADNIVGLEGIGPKTAEKMLDPCTTERELYDTCVKAYGGDEERVIENGRLLWLRREPEELWEPPSCG